MWRRASAVFGLALLGANLLACYPPSEPPPPKVVNEEFYGGCYDDYLRLVCRDDELFCSRYPVDFPDHSVCGASCGEDADCPPAPDGTAAVICQDSTCVLNCGESIGDCGEGMICTDAGVCMWEDP